MGEMRRRCGGAPRLRGASIALALLLGCRDGSAEGGAGAGPAMDAERAQDTNAAPIGAASGAASAGSAGFDAATFRKPTEDELRRSLTKLQFAVTQEDATEPPFRNAYSDEHRDGIYVDVVSGEPLFSSRDKFDSGTGWPSFTRPLEPANVVTTTDWKLILPRTEVRSKHADSHLGHVFDDGPPPTGKRYCMNSAALRFVPAENLAAAGYPEYAALFATGAKSAGTTGAPGRESAATAAGAAAPPAEAPAPGH